MRLNIWITSLIKSKHYQIEDNGIGMSDDTLKKVFIPFFTTKEIGVGKGLGLSSVTIRLPLICSLPDAGVF
ncbi:MAG: hypothetical protein HQK98_01935 [Nitrospirae bacterium]|nr:hypothetical protein [Nitrospirota bacterium]